MCGLTELEKIFKFTFKRNASNTPSNTHFSTHSLWLVEIHMGSTKFIWDPHDLVGPMWILTNQRECVEKCVLEGVLLAFLYLQFFLFDNIWQILRFVAFLFLFVIAHHHHSIFAAVIRMKFFIIAEAQTYVTIFTPFCWWQPLDW